MLTLAHYLDTLSAPEAAIFAVLVITAALGLLFMALGWLAESLGWLADILALWTYGSDDDA